MVIQNKILQIRSRLSPSESYCLIKQSLMDLRQHNQMIGKANNGSTKKKTVIDKVKQT